MQCRERKFEINFRCLAGAAHSLARAWRGRNGDDEAKDANVICVYLPESLGAPVPATTEFLH